VNDDVKTIAFVLYPGLTPLDLIGPLQVMSDWRHVDRDSFGPRVEGFAHQRWTTTPDLLARLLGSEPQKLRLQNGDHQVGLGRYSHRTARTDSGILP
jgi:hypothetical protein